MAKKKIPMCWKCASRMTEEHPTHPGSLILVGCKENDKIKNYNDAEKLCPLLHSPDK